MRKLFFTLGWLGWLVGLSLAPNTASGQAVQTVIFEDDFEEGSPKSAWILRPNLSGSNGLIQVVSGIGVQGSMGLSIGKSAHGAFTVNALDLPLDLSAHPEVELTFLIASIFDETQFNDGIFLSDDGGNNFTRIWEFPTSEWCGGYGQFPPIRLSKLAADHGLNPRSSQMVLRFSQEGALAFNSGSNQDGYYLDDVKVYVSARSFATLPFEEDFETGGLRSMWAWRSPEASTQIMNGTSFRSNNTFVAVRAGSGANGSTYSLVMGRNCSGDFTNQAVDLYLNLSGMENVEMTLDFLSLADETQIDDAIFFSDDGGETFTSVFELDPSQWCSGYDQFPPFDVDELAAQAGLSLTEEFVIRIQQRGNFFTSTSSNSDGMMIDNVKVYDPGLTYVKAPFDDGFETGRLGPMWAWRSAEKTAEIQLSGPVTRRSAWVGVAEQVVRIPTGYNSAYAAVLGTWCSDDFSNSALDLHLDLKDMDSVMLTGWIYSNLESAQLDDALYLSVDAGNTFRKAYQFDFASHSGFYQAYTFDLSRLADSLGLVLSDSVIVRFQQHGIERLGGSTSYLDGIFIDEVNLSGRSTAGGTGTTSVPATSSSLRLFPNPTEGRFTLDLGSAGPIEHIRLLDPQGRSMPLPPGPTHQAGVVQLDISHLPAGLYHLQVQAQGQRWTATVQRR